jgi:hypothetical protein
VQAVLTLRVHPRQTISWEEFCATVPPVAVALDGFVAGPPAADGAGHFNFDHHVGVARYDTPATCTQVVAAVASRALPDGNMDVHVNDADEDVSLSVWLLRNRHRCLDRRVLELVVAADALDTSGGCDASGASADLLGELCWVMAPYRQVRNRVCRLTASEMAAVIDEVGDRLDAWLAGRGGRVPTAGEFTVLARAGPVAVIAEDGPLARTGLRDAGIAVFASVRRQPDGRRDVTVGTTGPDVGVDLGAVFDRLNVAQGVPVSSPDRWAGSDTIGGSPRRSGTRLGDDVLLAALARAVDTDR